MKKFINNSISELKTEIHFKNGTKPKSLISSKNIKQRVFLLFAAFCVSITSMLAQDIITLKSGDDIQALVQEVGEVSVKYKKFENPNGPTYVLRRSDIFMIRYANGSKDVFADTVSPVTMPTDRPNVQRNVVELDEDFLEISRKNPIALLKRGNKVFVEANEASKGCSETYFIPYMNEWGYWTIVDNINEAHFIILFNVEGKAMGDRASTVVFKTRENQEFKRSKSYRASINAFNGYNAYRGTSKKIVEEYFIKEFY